MCGCKRATLQFIICVSYTCITRLLPPPRRLCCRRCLFVCLPVACLLATLRKKLRNGFAWNFQGRLAMGQWQIIKFWWRSGSLSGYRDCFPDSPLLGDTESCINRLRCATLQCRACTSRHRHGNYDVYDVITSRAMTNSHDRRALAEVCTVAVLLFLTDIIGYDRLKLS